MLNLTNTNQDKIRLIISNIAPLYFIEKLGVIYNIKHSKSRMDRHMRPLPCELILWTSCKEKTESQEMYA
jgi:hypothetical protein